MFLVQLKPELLTNKNNTILAQHIPAEARQNYRPLVDFSGPQVYLAKFWQFLICHQAFNVWLGKTWEGGSRQG